MFILFLAVWFIINAKISFELLIFGLAISAVMFLFICKFLGYSLKKEITLYRLIPLIIIYFIMLLWEIIKANFQVMKYIIMDEYDIEPVIVKFRCTLVDETCIALYANAITLTPGTITADVKDEYYTVHCLDKDLSSGFNECSGLLKILYKVEKIKTGGMKND